MLLGDPSDQASVIHMALTQNLQGTLLGGLTLGMLILIKSVRSFS